MYSHLLLYIILISYKVWIIKLNWIELNMIINGTSVNHVSTSKSLAVLIDANLTWGSHIEKLAKKIASGIAAIKGVRQFVPPATLHLIYKALIQPHFDYCNVVWGSCGIKLADKLQKLQNQCSASSNFLKLWRRCIAAVPKFKLEKS